MSYLLIKNNVEGRLKRVINPVSVSIYQFTVKNRKNKHLVTRVTAKPTFEVILSRNKIYSSHDMARNSATSNAITPNQP